MKKTTVRVLLPATSSASAILANLEISVEIEQEGNALLVTAEYNIKERCLEDVRFTGVAASTYNLDQLTMMAEQAQSAVNNTFYPEVMETPDPRIEDYQDACVAVMEFKKQGDTLTSLVKRLLAKLRAAESKLTVGTSKKPHSGAKS